MPSLLAIPLQILRTLDSSKKTGSIARALAGNRANQRIHLALRYGSWKKLFNFLRVELQLRFGRTKVWGYPFEWEIDTTNICQLKCPLCHTGLGTVNRQKGVMHFDLFKKTIDEIKDYCIWLSLYSWGEPFLNKEISKYVAYAHEVNLATIMSTNLNKPLTPEMAEELIRSGLDTLIISLDGVTQDVYEVYRVAGYLDRVLDNIKLLAQKKSELASQTPYLEWQFIVMRQNEHQIPEARRMAEEFGVDSIVFKNVDFPHGEDDPALAEQWLPVATEFRRDLPFAKPYKEESLRCWRLWRSAVVNWDGGYAPCCYLTDAADDFGNVSTQSVKEIWNNEHYKTARGLFKGTYLPRTKVGCMQCSVYLESKAAKIRGRMIPLAQNGHGPKQPVPPSEVAANPGASLKLDGR